MLIKKAILDFKKGERKIPLKPIKNKDFFLLLLINNLDLMRLYINVIFGLNLLFLK